MKNLVSGKKLPLVISTIAMAVAAASTSLCPFWGFNECKMPKSLYKHD